MLWNVNSAGFLILVNDYIVHNTSMDTEEAALGITILGNTRTHAPHTHVQYIA